jgi:hypothetical protein
MGTECRWSGIDAGRSSTRGPCRPYHRAMNPAMGGRCGTCDTCVTIPVLGRGALGGGRAAIFGRILLGFVDANEPTFESAVLIVAQPHIGGELGRSRPRGRSDARDQPVSPCRVHG